MIKYHLPSTKKKNNYYSKIVFKQNYFCKFFFQTNIETSSSKLFSQKKLIKINFKKTNSDYQEESLMPERHGEQKGIIILINLNRHRFIFKKINNINNI